MNRNIFTLATVLVGLALSACSVVPTQDLSALPPLEGQPTVNPPLDELFEVTDEMAVFVDKHAPRDLVLGRRTFDLAASSVDRYLMGFDYDSDLTLPPAEAFERRTGNCMSFALMLVAMARHAGIDARFEEVMIDPVWNSNEETYINIKHINVVIGRNSDAYIVDVSGDVLGNQITSRTLSDAEAAAQYYNNLGVDALLVDDLPTAFARFKQALEIDSSQAFLWSNIGVVYSRNGQEDVAEWAYKLALDMNRSETIAASNLHLMYQRQGRFGEAERFQRKVEKHRRRNPYYLAQLANEALESQQYSDAIKLLRKSIRLKDQEYRFYGALAQAQYLAGDHDAAFDNLDIARSLAPPAAAAELDTLPLSEPPY